LRKKPVNNVFFTLCINELPKVFFSKRKITKFFQKTESREKRPCAASSNDSVAPWNIMRDFSGMRAHAPAFLRQQKKTGRPAKDISNGPPGLNRLLLYIM